MCNALTVTKRESAPLPERLCERIAYCAILLTVYEADYSVVVAQSEGADHRYYSTPEMQNIFLQNAVGHAVRKAKNFAGGATDTIFSGRPALINYSSSLALRRWRRLISPFAAVTKKPAVLSPGSLSCSISSITSCGILTVVICDFAFFAPVAISGSPKNWCMSVYAKKMIKKGLKCISPVSKLKSKCEIHLKEQRPAVLATHAGRLTTNDNESIEVAMLNHTTHPQGRDSHNLNKYIWRFIALSTAQPRVIHIEATSEQEARQQSPAGCVMVFAARIRQEVHHD
ncbi:host cell division inhibitor Icd-like protein [Escherichia coli]|nr:ash family protein [Escherichia coli]EEY1040916.1 ash family protein [Escherichia coli]EEY1044121.1 ash family protein [Escherichia coli]EEY3145312.1 ash family protein [Escherichia coli]EFO1702302.1 host cell division inhibitor Icd-like protein [Escherichia coli]